MQIFGWRSSKFHDCPLSSFFISLLVWQAGDHVCKPRGLCGLSPSHIQEDREGKGRGVGGDRAQVPAQVTVFRIRYILGLKFGTGSSLFMTKKTAGYGEKPVLTYFEK